MNLELVSRACPICGSREHSSVFAESNVDVAKLDEYAFASRKTPEYMHWRLLDCARCDLLYASPAPTGHSLSAAYEEASFDSGTEARYAAATYAGLLPALKRRLPNLNGVLDIGTGDGAFLERLLDAGFSNVSGVEPSSAPIRAASPRARPLIRRALFRAEDYTPRSFSLITCFQTIEHLEDPLALARDIERLLRPGGAALFVAHNRRAFSARILGRRSPIFDIEHLQLFSPVSLRRLFATAFGDAADVEVGSVFNKYPIAYWVRLLPFPRSLKHPLISFLRFSGAGSLPVPMPAGNVFTIAWKARSDAS